MKLKILSSTGARQMIAPVALLLLASCSQGPRLTLSEQLQGRPPQERTEILRLACLNEADYTTMQKKAKMQSYNSRRSHMLPNTQETTRLKSICRSMTASMKDRQATEASRAALAQQCGAEIRRDQVGNDLTNKRHYQRMGQICEEMTGQVINTL